MSVNLYNATTDTLKNVAGDIVNPKSVNNTIAPTEETTTASRAYNVGEQFFLNDVLYKATVNISQGDTITIGTNCSASDKLTEQIDATVEKWSGTDSGNTYVTVDKLAYDPTNKRLGLKVNGADTVIPFKSGGVPLSSIAVTTMPTKTTYTENENLDLTGIVVTATFEDGVTADITNACTFNPADGTHLTTLGTITVDVDYYGVSTSFNVTCTSWDSNTMANNSWGAIQEHIVAGTLPASFVGQTKPITMGGNTYNLQLARINDGTGTAGTFYPNHTADFISVELMPNTHNMNSTNTNVGGWKQCAMRTYLTDTVYPALPDDLKAVIIDKTHMYTQGNQSTSFESVSDKLWLPTEWECFGSATYGGESATYNVHYSAIFPDAASRQKTRIGQTSANYWWESSPHVSYATSFCSVNSGGSANYNNASGANGVVLGLRIG